MRSRRLIEVGKQVGSFLTHFMIHRCCGNAKCWETEMTGLRVGFRFLNLVSIIVWLLAISACGGGKSNSSAPDSPGLGSQGPDSNSERIIVALDASVPLATTKLLTTVVSARGTAKPGEGLVIPSIKGQPDHMVFALQDGTPFLAAFASKDVRLSANTTAVALVRMAMGATYLTEISPDDFAAKVSQAPSFGALVTQVATALSAGATPLKSSTVAVAAKTVAAEVADALGPQPRVLASALASASLPHYFYDNGARDRIWLTNAAGNNLTFNNQSGVFWRVTTNPSDAVGVAIADPRSITLWQLFGDYGGSASHIEIVGSSPLFTVTADLGGEARKRNGALIINRIFSNVIAGLATRITDPNFQSCGLQFTSQFINDKLPALEAQQDFKSFLDYIYTASGFSSPGDAVATVLQFATACAGLQAEVKVLIPALFTTAALQTVSFLQLAASTFNTIDTISQVQKYYDGSFSVDVCKKNGEVVPCDFQLRITPASATLSLNQTVALRAELYDRDNQAWPASSGINWDTSNPAVATVGATGIVTAVSVGTAVITARDPATLTTATATINVTSLSAVDIKLEDYVYAPCIMQHLEAGTPTGGTNYFYDITSCGLTKKVIFTCEDGCLDANGNPRYIVRPRSAVITQIKPCAPPFTFTQSTAAEPVQIDRATGKLWAYAQGAGATKVVGSLDRNFCSVSYDIIEIFDITLPGGETKSETISYSLIVP